MVDFSQFDIDKDALVNSIAYNITESPSTQAYYNIAASNNPDYAQAIADIKKFGDIGRGNFNLGMQALAQSNAKKRQDELLDRAFKEKQHFANKMFEQNKQLAKYNFDLQEQQRLKLKNERDRQELRTMADPEYMGDITNWGGEENPEYSVFKQQYNNLVDKAREAKRVGNKDDFIYFITELEKMKENPISLVKPMNYGNASKYSVVNQDGPMDYLYGLFSNDPQTIKAANIKNEYNDDASNYGFWEKLWHAMPGVDNRAEKINKIMDNKQLGKYSWTANRLTKNLANQIMNDEDMMNFLGTHRLTNLDLITDPTTNFRNMYVVNKKNNTIFKVNLDANGNIVDFEQQ